MSWAEGSSKGRASEKSVPVFKGSRSRISFKCPYEICGVGNACGDPDISYGEGALLQEPLGDIDPLVLQELYGGCSRKGSEVSGESKLIYPAFRGEGVKTDL